MTATTITSICIGWMVFYLILSYWWNAARKDLFDMIRTQDIELRQQFYSDMEDLFRDSCLKMVDEVCKDNILLCKECGLHIQKGLGA